MDEFFEGICLCALRGWHSRGQPERLQHWHLLCPPSSSFSPWVPSSWITHHGTPHVSWHGLLPAWAPGDHHSCDSWLPNPPHDGSTGTVFFLLPFLASGTLLVSIAPATCSVLKHSGSKLSSLWMELASEQSGVWRQWGTCCQWLLYLRRGGAHSSSPGPSDFSWPI
jgi:hypothetical protein